ncbi:uncharacterized protein LOC143277127 [Babylonia areolata]|uniref:uncharacterized protein LOC143277127 n=1 Tax=Babylonia areolata TaxID=304850 RepID=UPI003FD25979
MDTLGVGIVIIVGCVIFKIISWILIYRNSKHEKSRLKNREKLRRHNRWDRNALGLLSAADIEKQPPTCQEEDADHRQTATPPPTTVTTTTDETTTKSTAKPVTPVAQAPSTENTGDADPSGESNSPPAPADPEAPEPQPKVTSEAEAGIGSGSRSGSSAAVPDVGLSNPGSSGSEVVSGAATGIAAAGVIAAAAAAKSSPSPSPPPPPPPPEGDAKVDEDGPQPDPQPLPDDLELPADPDLHPPPPVIVPSVAGAGLTALGISQAEPPILPPTDPQAADDPPVKPKRRKSKKTKKLTDLKNIQPAGKGADPSSHTLAPVSDFDDYHSVHLKHLPPPDPQSSPPPAQYHGPPGGDPPVRPPRTSRQIVHDRRKMEKRLRDQEGMDF